MGDLQMTYDDRSAEEERRDNFVFWLLMAAMVAVAMVALIWLEVGL